MKFKKIMCTECKRASDSVVSVNCVNDKKKIKEYRNIIFGFNDIYRYVANEEERRSSNRIA